MTRKSVEYNAGDIVLLKSGKRVQLAGVAITHVPGFGPLRSYTSSVDHQTKDGIVAEYYPIAKADIKRVLVRNHGHGKSAKPRGMWKPINKEWKAKIALARSLQSPKKRQKALAYKGAYKAIKTVHPEYQHGLLRALALDSLKPQPQKHSRKLGGQSGVSTAKLNKLVKVAMQGKHFYVAKRDLRKKQWHGAVVVSDPSARRFRDFTKKSKPAKKSRVSVRAAVRHTSKSVKVVKGYSRRNALTRKKRR